MFSVYSPDNVPEQLVVRLVWMEVEHFWFQLTVLQGVTEQNCCLNEVGGSQSLQGKAKDSRGHESEVRQTWSLVKGSGFQAMNGLWLRTRGSLAERYMLYHGLAT